MSRHELPSRGMQRELVFQRIKNPISREAIRSSIPSDERVDFSSYYAPEQTPRITDVVRREGSEAYAAILAVSTVARNYFELANTLGLLELIQKHVKIDAEAMPESPPEAPANEKRGMHIPFIKRPDPKANSRSDSRPKLSFLEQAQVDFLRSHAVTPFASDEARALQAEMIGIWNRQPPSWDDHTNYVKRELENKYLYESGYYEPWKRVEMQQHTVEAYFLTLLDPNSPFQLRLFLLTHPDVFTFGSGSYWHDREMHRYGERASFWRYVNAEWIYPDIFGGPQEGKDVKEWEIAGLRRTVDTLQREFGERSAQPRVDPATEAELRRLRSISERMQRAIKDVEEKLKIYKELGQHPLDALGIGYGIWKNATEDQRREAVLRAYREKARRYHYQVPHSDPSFNEVHQELANKEFDRLTKAYDYLNKHLDQEEF